MYLKEKYLAIDKVKIYAAGLFAAGLSVFSTAHADNHDHQHGYFDAMSVHGYGPNAAEIAKQIEDKPLNFDQLHTYDELVQKLYKIEKKSRGVVDVGPLIKNGSNDGLIDIDISYGEETTLREAVVLTQMVASPIQNDAKWERLFHRLRVLIRIVHSIDSILILPRVPCQQVILFEGRWVLATT